jgi:hypothetical protein
MGHATWSTLGVGQRRPDGDAALGQVSLFIIAAYFGEEGPHVHARGVAPKEEGLAVALGLLHEALRVVDLDLVESRHVVPIGKRRIVDARGSAKGQGAISAWKKPGMKQLADAVGSLMQHVEDIGEADNTSTDATAMIRPSCYTTRACQAPWLLLDDFKFQFFRQPGGWPGGEVTTDMPGMVNIRQDPFERTPSINSENLNNLGGGYMNDFYAPEFWRFVLVQQRVADLLKTAIDYPPMQEPASFNLEAVTQQVESVLKNKPGARAVLSAAPRGMFAG